MPEETVKITKQPNGWYTWTCAMDVNYYRESIRPGIWACAGIAVFLLVFGGVMSWSERDVKSFLIVAAGTAVFTAISALVYWLALSAENPQESYEMNDTYIRSGYGKSSVYFDYKKARIAIFREKSVELDGKVTKLRVFVPEEDMDFVKRYIKNQLPGDCDIRYLP